MGVCSSVPPEYDDSKQVAPGFEGEIVNTGTYIEGDADSSVGPHKLHVVSWEPPTPPRALVLVCHGLHEHALRYYSIAHELTARGVAVCGCDHYAHGRSDGERGLITDYKVLIKDFCKFAEWAKAKYGVPVSLLGHSMGCIISTLCVNKIGGLQSVIFSANPIHPGPGSASPQGIKLLHPVAVSGFGRALAGLLASIDPTGPAGPIDIMGITEDPEELDILLKDPHRYSKPIRNLTAHEILKMIPLCIAEYSKITVPFFCMHGTADSLAQITGSRELYMSVSTPWAYRNIIIYHGLHHELFHESPDAAKKCIGDAVEYFEQTLLKPLAPIYSQESSEIDVSIM